MRVSKALSARWTAKEERGEKAPQIDPTLLVRHNSREGGKVVSPRLLGVRPAKARRADGAKRGPDRAHEVRGPMKREMATMSRRRSRGGRASWTSTAVWNWKTRVVWRVITLRSVRFQSPDSRGLRLDPVPTVQHINMREH